MQLKLQFTGGLILSPRFCDDGLMGPLASIVREPGQVRKEAAEANDLSAEMWLIRPPPFLLYHFCHFQHNLICCFPLKRTTLSVLFRHFCITYDAESRLNGEHIVDARADPHETRHPQSATGFMRKKYSNNISLRILSSHSGFFLTPARSSRNLHHIDGRYFSLNLNFRFLQ